MSSSMLYLPVTAALRGFHLRYGHRVGALRYGLSAPTLDRTTAGAGVREGCHARRDRPKTHSQAFGGSLRHNPVEPRGLTCHGVAVTGSTGFNLRRGQHLHGKVVLSNAEVLV